MSNAKHNGITSLFAFLGLSGCKGWELWWLQVGYWAMIVGRMIDDDGPGKVT